MQTAEFRRDLPRHQLQSKSRDTRRSARCSSSIADALSQAIMARLAMSSLAGEPKILNRHYRIKHMIENKIPFDAAMTLR
jgi:hypothetical protein